MFRQDRATGVFGYLGRKPRTIPVRLELQPDGGRARRLAFDLVDDPFLAPYLLYAALNAVLSSDVKDYGELTVAYKEGSRIQVAGAEDIELMLPHPTALEGVEGAKSLQNHRRLVETMADESRRIARSYEQTGGWKPRAVSLDDPFSFDAWAWDLNRQFGQDALGRQILRGIVDGRTDHEMIPELTRWLNGPGRTYRGRMGVSRADAESYVENVIDVVRNYTADSNPLIARAALERIHFRQTEDGTWMDVRRAAGGRFDCEAACYDCLLSYTNQPDHRLLDRKDDEDGIGLKSALIALLPATATSMLCSYERRATTG